MEIHAEFLRKDWDSTSETPMLHLSYLINTLLPVRWIGWSNGSASKSYNSFLSQNPSTQDDSVTFVPTGSLAEGLGIPEAISRGDPSTVDVLSDFDLLCVFKGLKFSTGKITSLFEGFDGYLVYDYSPPGYARICLLTTPKNPAVCIYDEESGKRFFSSADLSNCVFSSFSVSDQDKNRTKTQQGPAMTVQDPGVQVLSNTVKVQPVNGIPMDFVPAFVCEPWPEQACSWKTRGIKSEWLNSDLITSITEDGCHIVGVPAKTSEKPEIEWRLSFSASEGRLAREAVTDHQRQCYIYLKILRHQIMKCGNNVLSSYVFKSVFFHCCEQLPVGYWKDYPGNCVLYMLDVLLECLKRKHVPTYFLPENNLVGHLSHSEIETAIELVEKLRLDPVSPVLNFTDDKCLLLHPILGTFRMVVQPVLDDMNAFKQHRNKVLSIKRGISESTSRMVLLYLREHSDISESLGLRKHQEAIRCLAEAFTQWLHVLFAGNSLGHVINYFGLSIRTLVHSLRFFKAAFSLSNEFPELTACKGNLACMYHASAYADGESVNTDYLKQAGDLFEQIYVETKSSVIDYVTFLLKLSKYEKAKRILEIYIKDNHQTEDMSMYRYTSMEMNTLDESLRKHVEVHGHVSGDGLSFAYFYMVKCLLALNPNDKVHQIYTILENLKTHKKNQRLESSFNFFEQAKNCVSQSF